MWRPDNWEEYNPDPCEGCDAKMEDYACDWFCREHDRYSQREQGAELMLEALQEIGIDSQLSGKEKGWWVFIPRRQQQWTD